MPAIAALGGMAVPALLFLLVNAGSPGSRGWGIPMATDIAFAIGVVAVLGRGVSVSLKLFLLTLAIVDDIGAITVIGLFYSSGLQPRFLVVAGAIVVLIATVNRAGVVWILPYVVLGAALWLATNASGVHATIAGVVLRLLTPARRPEPAPVARECATDLGDKPTDQGLDATIRLGRHSVSPAERIAHLLQAWTSFLIVPVFALANAGVVIDADSFNAPGASAVTDGVMLGLVAGKALGIAGAAWLAERIGIARLPEGATWPMMFGVALIGGVGFTVSLFVAELAFDAGPLQDASKLGVLAGSTVAATIGGIVLRRACRQRTTPV